METTNAKIGSLIAQIRQERGITQAEFARKLKTSQSAVNRMEHANKTLAWKHSAELVMSLTNS